MELTKSGCIYVVWTKQHQNSGEKIYKVGRTENFHARSFGYPKGTKLLHLFDSLGSDIVKFENAVHKRLKKKFKVDKASGNEFYIGEYTDIVLEIYKYWKEVLDSQQVIEQIIEKSEDEEYANIKVDEAVEKLLITVSSIDWIKVTKCGKTRYYVVNDKNLWVRTKLKDVEQMLSHKFNGFTTSFSRVSVEFDIDPVLLLEKYLEKNVLQ